MKKQSLEINKPTHQKPEWWEVGGDFGRPIGSPKVEIDPKTGNLIQKLINENNSEETKSK